MAAAPEKTPEQLQREKDAVKSLTSARTNMDAALQRISSLELALRTAVTNLELAAKLICEESYPYSSNGSSTKSHRQAVLEAAAKAKSYL